MEVANTMPHILADLLFSEHSAERLPVSRCGGLGVCALDRQKVEPYCARPQKGVETRNSAVALGPSDVLAVTKISLWGSSNTCRRS